MAFFPLGSPIKILHAFLISSMLATCAIQLIFLALNVLIGRANEQQYHHYYQQ
jgi:hypothetical protein